MRPTIGLCLIAKNEQQNVPQLFRSIRNCFDHIYFTDTGSEDDTINVANKIAEEIGTPITTSHFTWVNDFSKARNFSMKNVKTDYVMWLDLDDVMSDPEAFIRFRDEALEHADYWFATYDYAHNEKNEPVVSFMRERIFKTSLKPEWKYFLHEGVPPTQGMRADYITTWKVIHKRSMEDMIKDKNRNLRIFEENMKIGPLDPRMTFYYGKELFEAGKYKESAETLLDSSCNEKMEKHDRLLAIQYAAYAMTALEQYAQARQVAYQGLQIDPTRAEFHIIVGDSFLKQNRMVESLPSYSAAKKCIVNNLPGGAYAGAIFSHPDAYRHYPRNMIAQVLFNIGQFDNAYEEAAKAWDLYGHADSKMIMERIDSARKLAFINENAEQTQDIVITCPPTMFYEWDEGIAKKRGVGGSETAAIEMAKHLHRLTGLKVKIFNPRPLDYSAESGVEYISTDKINAYFSRFRPLVHIAWRHNIKITKAPTYLWCHDLMTQSVESYQHFDKLLCLSQFHKRYVMSRQGLKDGQIIVTRNGIEPKRFEGLDTKNKNPNKIVWSSSPDRGLERAIRVIEESRKELSDLELHVFYGLDNMYKNNAGAYADHLKKEMESRPWIKYHGNVQQDALVHHLKDAAIWLYPTNFLETFCITALEMLLCGVFPIARKFGALPDTLAKANLNGQCLIVDSDCETEDQVKLWSDLLVNSIRNEAWKVVKQYAQDYSWENVALEWIETMIEPELDKLREVKSLNAVTESATV